MYNGLVTSEQKRITLNFHRRLVERMKSYADHRRMKLNAMLKFAFEFMEDNPDLVDAKLKKEEDPYS